MLEMFKNYPQPADYKPDNYPKHRKPRIIEIMAGETAIHTFEVPFNVDANCNKLEVIYKLGINPIIIKQKLDSVINHDNTSSITSTLTPEETLLFKSTSLSAKVQLKFYMKDGSIVYSEIYNIALSQALDAENRIDSSDSDSDSSEEILDAIPDCPPSVLDHTWILQATTSNGKTTYAWVQDNTVKVEGDE